MTDPVTGPGCPRIPAPSVVTADLAIAMAEHTLSLLHLGRFVSELHPTEVQLHEAIARGVETYDRLTACIVDALFDAMVAGAVPDPPDAPCHR